ncbi:MAG: DinB family protein [Saprospiraceae bacterium]
MQFSLNKSLEILERTPSVLSTFLKDLSPEWTETTEGEDTWTAKEVLAHLIICEQTDWIPRFRVILSDDSDKVFAPIDMQAHFILANNNTMVQLLSQFEAERKQGIAELLSYDLHDNDYTKTAIHPKLGEVSLQQLVATWVTHDLTHIAQITRVIAKQNADLVGPFREYLSVLG